MVLHVCHGKSILYTFWTTYTWKIKESRSLRHCSHLLKEWSGSRILWRCSHPLKEWSRSRILWRCSHPLKEWSRSRILRLQTWQPCVPTTDDISNNKTNFTRSLSTLKSQQILGTDNTTINGEDSYLLPKNKSQIPMSVILLRMARQMSTI